MSSEARVRKRSGRGTPVPVAPQSQLNPLEVESDLPAGGGNAVSVVIPAGDYIDVARLVTGGFAAQLSLGFETVDDIQLAIELIVRTIPLAGSRVTVALSSRPDALTITIGTFEPDSVEPGLNAVVRDGLALESVLHRLVDAVEVIGGSSPALILRKRLEAARA